MVKPFLVACSMALCLGAVFVIPRVLRAPTRLPELPTAGQRAVAPAESAELTLVAVGDIMMARGVELAITQHDPAWPFALLPDGLFADADLVLGNFEGTVREQRHIEATNVLAFDTTPEHVPPLAAAGFTHLSLANNHGDDFGADVTAATRAAIADAGMIPFGDPSNSAAFVVRGEEGGIPYALVGFHAFGEQVEDVAAAIRDHDAAGEFVIVMPHWGNEYVVEPSAAQRAAARAFIAAGADLIIGAHPHVVQRFAVIDGVPVIFSLGNFLFDQDFSEATKTGVALRAVITDTEITLDFTPLRILDRQPRPDAAWMDDILAALGISSAQVTVERR